VLKSAFKLLWAAVLAVLAAAAAAKLLLKPHAETETEEIDLVSILGVAKLASSADPLYGGGALTVLGRARLDLRGARPAPTGIRLNLAVVMGAVSLVVPEGWRLRLAGDLKLIAGAVEDGAEETAGEDAVTVTVTGFIAFGRLSVAAGPPADRAARRCGACRPNGQARGGWRAGAFAAPTRHGSRPS